MKQPHRRIQGETFASSRPHQSCPLLPCSFNFPGSLLFAQPARPSAYLVVLFFLRPEQVLRSLLHSVEEVHKSVQVMSASQLLRGLGGKRVVELMKICATVLEERINELVREIPNQCNSEREGNEKKNSLRESLGGDETTIFSGPGLDNRQSRNALKKHRTEEYMSTRHRLLSLLSVLNSLPLFFLSVREVVCCREGQRERIGLGEAGGEAMKGTTATDLGTVPMTRP